MKKAKAKRPAAVVLDPDGASDTELFERAMADVARLAPDPRGRARPSPPVSPPPVVTSSAQHVEEQDDDYAALGVDRREIRKLKRGDYAAEGRRDLHGMTAAEARASVARFIENSRHSGYRCVCIVHGRGLHSEGRAPILRTHVREYLRSQRAVLAYADAPRSEGASGAVYVLLRARGGRERQ